MIDAMCAECRFLSSSIFGPRPGWKCARDPGEDREHDPTDQACGSFRRDRGASILVRQEIPVPVRPTGAVNWEKPKGRMETVEVVPQAPYWEGRTVWLRPDQLIWDDNTPVGAEELDSICRFEAEVAAAMSALARSGERMAPKVVRAVAEGLVEAVRDLGLPVAPADLVGPIGESGRLGDLVCGVSAHRIVSDLAKAGRLSKSGVDGSAGQGEG